MLVAFKGFEPVRALRCPGNRADCVDLVKGSRFVVALVGRQSLKALFAFFLSLPLHYTRTTAGLKTTLPGSTGAPAI